MFKSTIVIKFSYLLEKWLRILINSLVNSRSLTTGGLYVPTKSHFRFTWWNSKPIISIFISKSGIFNGLQEIPSWTCNIRPPPYLLRSHMKILKSFIWNCLFGQVSSSLDSDIRNILTFSINSANVSYLFRKKLILRWPIITVFGSLKRWFLKLARSLADCSNKFEKPQQDVSFKKGELAMLLRLSLLLRLFLDIPYKYWPTIGVEVQPTSIKMSLWIYVRMVNNRDVFSFTFFDQYIA